MPEQTSSNRRRQNRQAWTTGKRLQLWVEKEEDSWQRVAADLENGTEFGLGVISQRRLEPGQRVLVDGAPFAASQGGRTKGLVIWCDPIPDSRFRIGVAVERLPSAGKEPGAEFCDFYALLEVHSEASLDTIHRVYRILAQRFHPDNPETGNEEHFKLLSTAHRVLSNPDLRAQYDAYYRQRIGRQWKIFDPKTALAGVAGERRKRNAALAALYVKRVQCPEQPTITIPELEELLGVPREHLEFTLWFLREQAWATRTDNGRFAITAKGVLQAEESGAWQAPAGSDQHLLDGAHPA